MQSKCSLKIILLCSFLTLSSCKLVQSDEAAKTDSAGSEEQSFASSSGRNYGPGGNGQPKMHGVWIAGEIWTEGASTQQNEQKLKNTLARMKKLGLNTMLANVDPGYMPYRTNAKFSEYLKLVVETAKQSNIDVQAWVETGIQDRSPPTSANKSEYLSCSDAKRYGGNTKDKNVKWYRDVTNANVQKKFIARAVEIVKAAKITSLHYDDHVGYDVANLPCLKDPAKYKAALTSLMQKTGAAVRAAAPHTRFEYDGHHNPYGLTDFLQDWQAWNLDGVYTQNYVAASFDSEIQRAIKMKVKGVGLSITSGGKPNTLLDDEARKAVKADLGFAYFRLPAENAELVKFGAELNAQNAKKPWAKMP